MLSIHVCRATFFFCPKGVGRALHYAGQLVRRRGKRVTISLPSATTARDLQPTRPGDTRSNTSHRDIARNNSLKLQQLGTHVTIRVEEATTSQDGFFFLEINYLRKKI